MADKQININIVTKADKSEAEDLIEVLDLIKEKAEEVGDSMSGIGTDVDSSGLEDLAGAGDDASSSLDDASASADDVSSSAGSIDSSAVEKLSDGAGDAKTQFDGLNESVKSANDSMSMIDAMAGAELSSGIVSGFTDMSNSAGDYNDQMVRLNYALDGTSATVEQAEQKYGSMISSMREQTGRGAGDVRQHLINMGNVGITNSQVLQDSFNAISKASFQMNTDIGAMDGAFQKMVLSGMAGKRQLSAFGISVKDLGQAMGVSADEASKKFQELDENTRASVLSTAINMKYGEDVTENYKNSYQHLNEELQRAKDYLIRVVGEAILPTLIPAINTASGIINVLAGAFRGLPAPIKMIIGGAIGLTAGLTSAGLAIGAVVKIVGSALSPFMKLFNLLTGANVKTIAEFARAMKTLGIEVLKAGANALRSAGMWLVQKAQLIASTVATWAQTASQWALNLAMSMNPIMIVVLAIIALIAVLGYLYFNNEQVRQGIDWLGQSFMYVGQIIYTSIINAINWVISALQGLWTYIMTLGGLIPANVGITGNQIIDSILKVIIFLATLPIQIGIIFVNIIAKALGFGNNFVQNLLSAGSRAVSNFMSSISQLPSRLAGELNSMLSTVGQWASTLPQKFWDAGVNAVKNFLSALGIASPGIMQRTLVWEISEMARRTPIEAKPLYSNISKMGDEVVDSFGNPSLSVGTDFANEDVVNNSSEGAGQIINLTVEVGTVDNEERVNQIVDVVRRELAWDNKTAGRSV